MGAAVKHPVPDRVKPSFVFLTSGHSDAQSWASECPDVKNYKWRLNPVWHKMLYSCTHMATVGVQGLKMSASLLTLHGRQQMSECEQWLLLLLLLMHHHDNQPSEDAMMDQITEHIQPLHHLNDAQWQTSVKLHTLLWKSVAYIASLHAVVSCSSNATQTTDEYAI